MWVLLLTSLLIVSANGLNLTGEHICQKEERYTVNVTQNVVKNATVRSYVWCVDIPPRCSTYKINFKNVKQIVEEERIRQVPICCEGYEPDPAGEKCAPQCKHCVNGVCDDEHKCYCHPGYRGDHCERGCEFARWGRYCRYHCTCERGDCDPKNGHCECPNGWIGTRCEQQCPHGYFGLQCKNQCQCSEEEICNPSDGRCLSQEAYLEDKAQTETPMSKKHNPFGISTLNIRKPASNPTTSDGKMDSKKIVGVYVLTTTEALEDIIATTTINNLEKSTTTHDETDSVEASNAQPKSHENWIDNAVASVVKSNNKSTFQESSHKKVDTTAFDLTNDHKSNERIVDDKSISYVGTDNRPSAAMKENKPISYVGTEIRPAITTIIMTESEDRESASEVSDDKSTSRIESVPTNIQKESSKHKSTSEDNNFATTKDKSTSHRETDIIPSVATNGHRETNNYKPSTEENDKSTSYIEADTSATDHKSNSLQEMNVVANGMKLLTPENNGSANSKLSPTQVNLDVIKTPTNIQKVGKFKENAVEVTEIYNDLIENDTDAFVEVMKRNVLIEKKTSGDAFTRDKDGFTRSALIGIVSTAITICILLIGAGLYTTARIKEKHRKQIKIKEASLCARENKEYSFSAKSIFHFPLPDPPDHYNDNTIKRLDSSTTFKSIPAKSPESTYKTSIDYLELFYDQPPTRGTYRAASAPEPPSLKDPEVPEVTVEPIYDEIPSWVENAGPVYANSYQEEEVTKF